MGIIISILIGALAGFLAGKIIKVHVIHGFCCDLPGMEISGDAYAFQTGRGFGKITSG